jgi:S-adenosylmethionine hydrolase
VARRPVIAILTDFGLHDQYVGAMKGVALGICPDVTLVDITHDIPAQDIAAGARALESSYTCFPHGTVFLCVVDPGVGSKRRAIALEAGGYRFVAPDNGLLSLAVDATAPATIVEITNPAFSRPTISRTFEGRDRFAPAAAWLAAGTPIGELGPVVTALNRLTLSAPVITEEGIAGEIVRVDRFGNLITNIDQDAVRALGDPADVEASVGAYAGLPLVFTFSDVEPGAPCALIGSTGHLEIACRGENAARRLRAGRGDAVHLARRA